MVFGLVSEIPQLLVAQKHFQGTRGTNQCARVPASISTGHATVYSTFFSARHVLGCNAVFLEIHYVYQIRSTGHGLLANKYIERNPGKYENAP